MFSAGNTVVFKAQGMKIKRRFRNVTHAFASIGPGDYPLWEFRFADGGIAQIPFVGTVVRFGNKITFGEPSK